MSMTPYAAAKVVNALLAEAGVDKVLPPQMFYNYTTARIRQDKAPFIPVDENNKITEDGLKAWAEKYLAKQVVATPEPTK